MFHGFAGADYAGRIGNSLLEFPKRFIGYRHPPAIFQELRLNVLAVELQKLFRLDDASTLPVAQHGEKNLIDGRNPLN